VNVTCVSQSAHFCVTTVTTPDCCTDVVTMSVLMGIGSVPLGRKMYAPVQHPQQQSKQSSRETQRGHDTQTQVARTGCRLRDNCVGGGTCGHT
jgi:hypothetical protein